MDYTLDKAQKVIEKLKLQEHPEGGYFKETYRSEALIPHDSLVGNFKGDRNISTAIYFMLTSEMFSAFHKVEQDELWHFHFGSSIELHTISPEGIHATHIIGNDIMNGEQPQLTVEGGDWFCAKVKDSNSFSLVSCTVAPGFDFRDFILPSKDEMVKLFPQHETIISEFTRH